MDCDPRVLGLRARRLGSDTKEGKFVMTTQEVANDLVGLWKAGKFAESGEKYWADDVVSVEAGAPGGGDPASRGKAAARGKGEWWAANHDIHGVAVEGPFVNGDQFVVRFKMDITPKESGQRTTMDEMAVYTIKDGKIAEERFFYNG
jgi:ketosteroid isomerase-like protein